MPEASIDSQIQTVRRFNRFYTRQIGVLQDHLLESPYSLTEVRILYELAHHERLTARDLCLELGLDAGYVSRILRAFEKRALVQKHASAADARQIELTLTAAGRKTFAALDHQSSRDVDKM